MKLTRTLLTVCTTAVAVVALCAGAAVADDDLLSALNNPAIGAACLPSGQAGVGNTVNGTQNVSCSQSTSQDITNPTPAADGGVTGQVIETDPVEAFANTFSAEAVQCPVGKIATGGGFMNGDPALNVLFDAPSADGTAWVVGVNNPTNTDSEVTGFAVCVDAA
ncbi:hypothetical protein [Streptomyces sp. NPDC047976]|uniref:hypothetical protein n=1 Tax=unclassified Streptomyces TaxID=2593676 RepID=UPI0034199586